MEPLEHKGAVFRLPSPLASIRHALPGLIESAVVPAVLFYVFLSALGLKGALIAGLAWSYLALIRRLVVRQRVPGMLMVGCAVLTVRTVIALMTGRIRMLSFHARSVTSRRFTSS